MNKPFLPLLLLLALMASCKKDREPFLIGHRSIGSLTDSSQVKNLESLFPNDSIAAYEGDATFRIPKNTIEVYEKGGPLLLSLTPKNPSDSTATITTIRIHDARFKTNEGISTASRFKDIQAAYKISKIDNLIDAIVVSVNEIDAQFAIEKTELPANLRYDMNLKFEASQIPDHARIKYFFINWD